MDPHTSKHDRAARRKIEEAMTTHFLSTNFQRMLDILLATSDACGDQCSPEVHAELWMYAGIVFGSGKNDLYSAQCAFEIALAWDPKVTLDEAMSTDKVKAAFATARRKVCGE